MKLEDYFEFIQGYDSSSGSSSDFFLVREKGTNLMHMMKVFVDRKFILQNSQVQIHSTEGNGIYYELQIYLLIRQKLVEPILVNLRNILCISGNGTFTMDELIHFVNPTQKLTDSNIKFNVIENTKYMMDMKKATVDSDGKVVLSKRNSISKKRPKSESQMKKEDSIFFAESLPFLYECIITPKIGSDSKSSFHSLMYTWRQELPKEKFITILFNYMVVILSSIYVMAENGFNQNDLHWDNILTDNAYFGSNPKQKRRYFLILDDTLILVDLEYTPVIFDFDRSTMKGFSSKILEEDSVYSMVGHCPTFHAQRDMLKCICELYHFSKKYDLQTICEDISKNLVSDKSLVNQMANPTMYHGQEAICSFVNPDGVSTACKPEVVEKSLVPNKNCVQWALRKSSLQRYSIEKLYESDSLTKDKLDIAQWFTSDLPKNLSDQELRGHILANTQFATKTNHVDLATFVEHIAEFIRPKTFLGKIKSSLKKISSPSLKRF